jgi:hypothetical protein
MKTQTDNGGPAFPTQNGCRYDAGMTLRDYFAAAALQGLLANYDPESGDFLTYETPLDWARFAHKFADAMLAARKEEA